mgnify:CR=1 FL=1
MATKIKTRFFCQECGYETAKWLGQCPGCKAWNSLVEEPVSVTAGGKEKKQVLSGVQSAPAVLNEISMEEERRTETGMGELDRVLGGGIVTGSLTLVGGDPGIGKSTLLLQMCRNLSLKKQHILYVSGEESLRQIKMRAMRIGDFSDTLELFCETNLNRIEEVIQQKKPQIVIIDSIQTMYNEAVSAARLQVPECSSIWWIRCCILRATDMHLIESSGVSRTVLAQPMRSACLRCAKRG